LADYYPPKNVWGQPEDSFSVANTSRQFEAFAKRRGLPFLILHGGTINRTETDGSILWITRRRGPFGFASGFSNFRFLIVGQGAEQSWLKANLRKADFTGVLKGEALARAYANMDAFHFPRTRIRLEM
jgi:hypothetical protein